MRPLTVLLSSTGLVACLAAGGSCERPAAVQVPLPPGTRVGWYVTIDGSSNGNGTNARPWDLQTALGGGNGQVHPGDTIWLRAGTYAGAFHSELTGTAAAAIVVRQYPGERAILDGRGATSSSISSATGSTSTPTPGVAGSTTSMWRGTSRSTTGR